MNRIIYLPLDERPCNYKFPQELMENFKDANLIVPSLDILGKKKISSDYNKIKEFLINNISKASALVISLDQLLYGGIVPSRIHHLTIEEINLRVSLLKELKELNPKVKIYAFLLIMRCPRYSSSDEEPDYYEQYGEEIFKAGVSIHKNQAIENKSVDFNNFLNDYISRRKINLNATLGLINYLGSIIDYLVIPQDDSAPYGFTMMDRLSILESLDKVDKNLYEIYPGADEVGMTLISRCLQNLKNVSIKIYPEYLYIDAKKLIPAYENKPLEDTVSHQINAAGSTLVSSRDEADVILYLNYHYEKQAESFDMNKPIINHQQWELEIELMKRSLKNNQKIAVVDKVYVNGGCLDFAERLFKEIPIDKISGYAGWNTSSNSMGTVISSAVIACLNKENKISKFISERIVDDVCYEANLRKEITNDVLPIYHLNYFNAGEVDGKIARIVQSKLDEFYQIHFHEVAEKYPIKKVILPWARMFEVDVTNEENN